MSKEKALPLVAARLRKIKDPNTGKMVDRSYTCFDVADKVHLRVALSWGSGRLGHALVDLHHHT